MRRFLTIAAAALGLLITSPMVSAQNSPQPKPPAHPYTKRHLYDESADPNVLIADALKQARAEHKRVILDFGGDWCGDCQVLDIYFHDEMNSALLEKNYIVVHIFIASTMDNHIDVATRYGIPIKKGVPALAVLSASGKVLYSQRTGEFEDMRHMDVTSVNEFLKKWKS